jgi:hypothetical protein
VEEGAWGNKGIVVLLSSGGDAELRVVDCWVVNGGGNSDRRRSLKGHGWISGRGMVRQCGEAAGVSPVANGAANGAGGASDGQCPKSEKELGEER